MNLYARFMTWLGADSLSPGEDVRYSRRAFLRESWRILRWFLILPILWIIWYVLEALFEGRDTTIAMLQFFIVITALLMVVLLCRAVLVWSYNHLSPTTKVIVRNRRYSKCGITHHDRSRIMAFICCPGIWQIVAEFAICDRVVNSNISRES